MRALGTVVGLADYGVFVCFYGDMKGLVHISELGLDPGTEPAAAFKIGQVSSAAAAPLNSQCCMARSSPCKTAVF